MPADTLNLALSVLAPHPLHLVLNDIPHTVLSLIAHISRPTSLKRISQLCRVGLSSPFSTLGDLCGQEIQLAHRDRSSRRPAEPIQDDFRWPQVIAFCFAFMLRSILTQALIPCHRSLSADPYCPWHRVEPFPHITAACPGPLDRFPSRRPEIFGLAGIHGQTQHRCIQPAQEDLALLTPAPSEQMYLHCV